MILHSDRLKPGDLDAWEACEKYDALYARLPDLQRKLDKSRRYLRSFLADRTGYLGVSWGKDSVAAMAVMCSLPRDLWLPVVWIKVDILHNPECVPVRDAMLERFDVSYHEIDVPLSPDEIQAWREHFNQGSRFSLGSNVGIAPEMSGFQEARKIFGDRHISGVRAEESTVRRMRCNKYGINSAKTSAPLSFWSLEDVFAYLYRENLPVNATYAMTLGGFIERDKIRVDAFGGSEGTGLGIGRDRWEATYFPDIMESIRIASMNP